MILGRLATLAARRGDHAEAARIAAILAQPAHTNSSTIVWRSRIAAQLGQPQQAVNLLKAALAEYRPYGLWIHTDPDLVPLHGTAAFERLLQPSD